MRFAHSLEILIDQLLKLPTIGPKSAQRLALFILKLPVEEALALAQAIVDAREKIFACPQCGNLTDTVPCAICQDDARQADQICVVEDSADIIAIEKTGYRGRYFVINTEFNVLGESNLEDINLAPLLRQLSGGRVKEIIIAVNPDIDGEILARYIAETGAGFNVKITRLAHGLPVGGHIEYADEITLRRAIEGRKEI